MPAGTVAALRAAGGPGGHMFISTINRNPKSFVLAIVGARIPRCGWCPRGTHEYARLHHGPRSWRALRAPPGSKSRTSPACNYDPLSRAVLAHRATPASTTSCTWRADDARMNESRGIAACCSTSTARCSTPRTTWRTR